MALLLLDLDRFKDVNDTMGHPVGDLLLKAVSERLIGCLRETDTVARLSGDEFAIIATNLSRTRDAAELARKIIDELARPYDLTGKEVSINSSVGVSLFGPEVENASKLLSDADAALYQAKNGGRGIFRFFDDEMNQKEQARKGLEMDLRKAMDGRQFFLQFQPKLDIENRHVVGAEALLRWNHPARGLVAPDQAIPIAEATGLIIPIGDWVIREACKQVAAWQRGGLPPIPIAVNTSALQFKRPGLLDTVTEALAEARVPADLFELEITERVIIDQAQPVTDLIRRIHDCGVGIAIDDFGIAYSSLRVLADFPVQKLKIDKHFVRNIPHDPKHMAVAKTIIALGRNLGLTVVAEGVETEAQLSFLREHGCDEIQGYYLSPPLGADSFAAWFRETQPCVN